MNYSEYYYQNITNHKALSKGLWALRVTMYVINHASIWNNWLHYQTIKQRNNLLGYNWKDKV